MPTKEERKKKRKANRKPFNESGLGKFLSGAGSTITSVLGDVLPDSGVLSVIKNLIVKDKDLTPEDREHALRLLEMDLKEAEEVSARWDSDMVSDSWMSKNVRPLCLMFLTVITMLFVIMDSYENSFQIDDVWIDLLKNLLITVYIAYFGSRGVEKYTKINK